MATGIQLFSGAGIKIVASKSSTTALTATVPIPEPVSGTLGALLGQGAVGVEASGSGSSERITQYSHDDERVWAAQFMRLKLRFHKEGGKDDTPTSCIELHNLRDLGLQGMKGAQRDVDRDFAEIVGLQEDQLTQEEIENGNARDGAEDDWALFQKLQELQINESSQARHALLIGGSAANLQGIGRDLATMGELLIDRGFEVTVCYEDATRDNIFQAWHGLIQRTKEHDTVVVYYSGHGVMGVSSATDRTNSLEQWRLQCICPIDFDETTEMDFRGIADIEVSHLLERLTAKTHNVTVILDCCYSGHMARGPQQTLRAKRFPEIHVGIVEHIRRMRSQGIDLGDLFVGGNPSAVRIFAAASNEVAYEGLNSDKEPMGMFTDELVRAIKAAGDHPVSWNAIILRVRDKLAISSPYQHPQLEGPWDRLLFSLDKVDAWGVLGLRVENEGKAILQGGHILGVSKGDIYSVMPFTAERVNAEEQIATATVKEVHAATAVMKIDFQRGHEDVPKGAKAFPLTKQQIRFAVLVQGDDSFTKPLKVRLDSSKLVRNVDENEGGTAPFATTTPEGKTLTIFNSQRRSIFQGNLASASIVDDAMSVLENLARASHLLELDGRGREALPAQLDVEFGLVDAGQTTKLPADNISVREGDSVYLGLRNKGTNPVYVSVFDVNASGTISLLSDGEAEGIELPGLSADTQPRTHYVGEADFGDEIEGVEVQWPDAVPRDGPVDETVVIVTTNKRLHLRSLSTDQRDSTRTRSPQEMTGLSQLELLAYHLSGGVAMRDLARKSKDTLRFHVHRVYFQIQPNASV